MVSISVFKFIHLYILSSFDFVYFSMQSYSFCALLCEIYNETKKFFCDIFITWTIITLLHRLWQLNDMDGNNYIAWPMSNICYWSMRETICQIYVMGYDNYITWIRSNICNTDYCQLFGHQLYDMNWVNYMT